MINKFEFIETAKRVCALFHSVGLLSPTNLDLRCACLGYVNIYKQLKAFLLTPSKTFTFPDSLDKTNTLSKLPHIDNFLHIIPQ